MLVSTTLRGPKDQKAVPEDVEYSGYRESGHPRIQVLREHKPRFPASITLFEKVAQDHEGSQVGRGQRIRWRIDPPAYQGRMALRIDITYTRRKIQISFRYRRENLSEFNEELYQ